MLKAVIGIENPANEYQIKNVGRWISVRTSENYPQLSDRTSFKNKLMSNPGSSHKNNGDETSMSRRVCG